MNRDTQNIFEEEDNGELSEGWAIAYGDVMSLLLAFLITILSFSTVNIAKYEDARKYLSGDFEKETDLKSLEIDLTSKMQQFGITESIEIERDEMGLVVTLKDNLLFDTGKAEMKEIGKKLFIQFLQPLREVTEKYDIEIEGHTDSVPISSKEIPSNWYLSTDRALSILDIFLAEGFSEKEFSVQGFADQKPLVEERDAKGNLIPENMAKNRRVVIKIR